MSEPVDLTAEQARCVALRLAARHLSTEWLEWEDVPGLSEDGWDHLGDAVDSLVADMYRESRKAERLLGVYLLERIE